MAKAVYVGVGSKARKMKKAYIGIGGTARKVKKMYIGDSSGKARLCYSAELEYVGTATALSEARNSLSAASVGNYAIFAGGKTSYNTGSSYVDAYDSSLVRTSVTSLNSSRGNLGSATVGSHALFAGGGIYYSLGAHMRPGTSYYYGYSTVEAYDTSLTKTTATSLSMARMSPSGVSIGKYALLGGGYTGVNGASIPWGQGVPYYYKNVVDAYNESLTRTTATALSVARNCTGVTIGSYALFAGGTKSDAVDAYDTSLTRTTVSSLSASGVVYGATTIGRYALIGIDGGTMNVYDTSLTRTTAASLSASRTFYSSANIGDYALFAGGYSSSDYYSTVDAYDSSLVRTTATSLNTARCELAAATVGDYAIFAGGERDSNSNFAVVDVYTA